MNPDEYLSADEATRHFAATFERAADRTHVYLNDYRYSGPSGRDGWAGMTVEVEE